MITVYGYATHEGAVRQVNEDNFCVSPDIGLFAVADGMGGHRGGRAASRITVENLAGHIKKGNSLTRAIEDIHHDILQAAASDPALNGMGSTVVAMKTVNDRYDIAWVGDSRAYAWDGTTLKQLTRDHSYVQYLLEEGHITSQEAHDHPQRNIILQALGAQDMKDVVPDKISGICRENEIILLCSDGLTTEVDDAGIAAILSREMSLQDAADRLVEAAISNGGSDNITVILVAAPESPYAAADPLDDTDPFDIAETITDIDDLEKTEIDNDGLLQAPGQATLVDDNEKTEIDEAMISPDKGPEVFADDLETTRTEENFGFDHPDNGPAAGQGSSALRTICYAAVVLAALLAIAVGLAHLP